MSIRIFVTGGTFDKQYNELTGSLAFTETHVPEMLRLGRCRVNVAGKTIVLTGAMIPYAFGSSDGLFNLGSALSLAQTLPPGVYVAMNGRYFTWDRVTKNRETGVFESL